MSRRQKAAAPKAADKAGLPAPRAEQDISQIEAQVPPEARKNRILDIMIFRSVLGDRPGVYRLPGHHSRRETCGFQILDCEICAGRADSLPVYYETGTKRLTGRGHAGLARINGFCNTPFSSLKWLVREPIHSPSPRRFPISTALRATLRVDFVECFYLVLPYGAILSNVPVFAST